MSLVQQQRRCDGRTYRAETVEQRVDGSWQNEDADPHQLHLPHGSQSSLVKGVHERLP